MIYEKNCRIELKRKSKQYLAFFVIGVTKNLTCEDLIFTLNARELLEYNNQLNDKRKEEYNLGRYVAKKSVIPILGYPKSSDITIGRGVFNQPILYHLNNSNNIQVSISHSNNVAVSISFPEEHPMGIDIEKISVENESALITQIMPKEMDIIDSLELPKYVGLTLLWTAKESLSKVLKTGLTVPLSFFSISKIKKVEGGFITEFENFYQYKTFSWLIDNYLCTICLPKQTTLTMDIEKVNSLPIIV